jgi:two-component system, NarL family, response regulator
VRPGDGREPEAAREREAREGEPVRVLVADDHADVRQSLARWIEGHPRLRLAGLASDGHEAIAKVTWLRPDLVIMDASMPFLDGFEATRALKRLPDAPRVVYVSLLDDATSAAESEAAGADAFLCKAELVTRLDQLLDRFFPPRRDG